MRPARCERETVKRVKRVQVEEVKDKRGVSPPSTLPPGSVVARTHLGLRDRPEGHKAVPEAGEIGFAHHARRIASHEAGQVIVCGEFLNPTHKECGGVHVRREGHQTVPDPTHELLHEVGVAEGQKTPRG